MKELFIENLHCSLDNIESKCKHYLSDTKQFILLLTSEGEYKISKQSSKHNKFEKINKQYLSSYTTTISDKTIYINDIHINLIKNTSIPNTYKEFIVTKHIYKLYLNTNVHFIVETIQSISELHDECDFYPLNQTRCYFELMDKTDEKNKIVEKELIQWFNIFS